jgi:hypothetical protein
MKASSSYNYFSRTLRKALNYFCQTQQDENTSMNQSVKTVNKSYTLFIDCFPKNFIPRKSLEQEEIRKCYKQMFDKPILELNANNTELLTTNRSPNESIISTTSTECNFYDMQPKNFGADKVRTLFDIKPKMYLFVKGAPAVCTVCYKSTHGNSECPALSLPKIINLPRLSREWINTLSRICRQVAGKCIDTHLFFFKSVDICR